MGALRLARQLDTHRRYHLFHTPPSWASPTQNSTLPDPFLGIKPFLRSGHAFRPAVVFRDLEAG